MDEEITLEIKRALIEQRVALWRNTAFQAGIDFRVAKRFEDADLMAAAKANVERAEKYIAAYGEELAALNGKVKEAGV